MTCSLDQNPHQSYHQKESALAQKINGVSSPRDLSARWNRVRICHRNQTVQLHRFNIQIKRHTCCQPAASEALSMLKRCELSTSIRSTLQCVVSSRWAAGFRAFNMLWSRVRSAGVAKSTLFRMITSANSTCSDKRGSCRTRCAIGCHVMLTTLLLLKSPPVLNHQKFN